MGGGGRERGGQEMRGEGLEASMGGLEFENDEEAGDLEFFLFF